MKHSILVLAVLVLVASQALAVALPNNPDDHFVMPSILKDDGGTLVSSANKISCVTATPDYSETFQLERAKFDNEGPALGVIFSCDAWTTNVTVTLQCSNDGSVWGTPAGANALDTTTAKIQCTETVTATGDVALKFQGFPPARLYRLKFSGGTATFDHLSVAAY